MCEDGTISAIRSRALWLWPTAALRHKVRRFWPARLAMSTYRYIAKTLQGDETAGIVDAASLDAALQILVQRNLLEIQVFALPDHPSAGPPPPVSLTSREAGELSQHVAQVSTANLPLSAGLRAAAEETTSRRVALALRWIAGQLDQGRSLEETLTESGRLLPAHISGLILAAARTGSLGEALFELVELQQKTYSLRRELAGGLLYPLFVLLLATGILVLTGYYVTGAFKNIFSEFGLQLPMFTEMLLWWRDTGIWFVGGFVASLLLLTVILSIDRRGPTMVPFEGNASIPGSLVALDGGRRMVGAAECPAASPGPLTGGVALCWPWGTGRADRIPVAVSGRWRGPRAIALADAFYDPPAPGGVGPDGRMG